MLKSKLDCDGFVQVQSFLWVFVKSGCFLKVILKSSVFLVVVAT